MIPELGQYALILAMCLALVQSTLPLAGSFSNNAKLIRLGHFTAWGQLFFIGLSFVILAYAFVSNDFSVAYVAENSNRHLPLIYRFCAVWGAHEGSMLLWVFILSIWMTLVSLFSRRLPNDVVARVLSVLGMISLGFLLFIVITSNPFVRLLPAFPLDGRDLNPLLQDPGLVSHPPMLYMGYVGFSVAFAFAISALMGGHLDSTWARWTRPWTLAAWCFLTLGIVLGSWWAYRELGWGGWWFWDPVENASFMPWLVGTALIHSLIVAEKRDTFKAWTVLMAILAFALSLIGTFLVRSGILISVHAFAVDPKRGAYILKFLSVVIGGSLLLYALRAHTVRATGRFHIWSRETLLLSNNVLLTVAMATVLLGTLYPLFIQVLGLGKLSVGLPYFNAVFIPLIIPLLLLMGIGPLFYWRRTQPGEIIKRLRFVFVLCIILALAFPMLIHETIKPWTTLGLFVALWVMLLVIQSVFMQQHSKRYGMLFAHLGVAICGLGIVMTSTYSLQRDVRLAPGEEVTVGAYQFRFLSEKPIQGPNYTGIEGALAVEKNNKAITILHPQLRNYTVQQTTLAKSAIQAGFFRDIYVAISEPIGPNAYAMRIYYKPFVRWIWMGGLMMVLGGLIAIVETRMHAKKIKRVPL